MKQVVFYITLILYFGDLFAQVDLKRDDFIGNSNRNWWKWHNDPTSIIAPTNVLNGYVSFSLVNPIVNDESPYYCDGALWNGYPSVGGPYGNVTITLRARATTPHQSGSRGWGLWYTEGSTNITEQIWFMQSIDNTGATDENWWRAEKTHGLVQANHEYVDLDLLSSPIDIEEWHTYKIIRESDYVEMIIDGETILYTEDALPASNMAFHIWVDNLIYDYQPDPYEHIVISQRSWTGTNKIALDYVQIETTAPIDKSLAANGTMLLRKVPNEMFTLETAQLWKSYDFTSANGGDFVFLITGRVENYIDESPPYEDDDMRFIIDGIDYQWNSSNSFDGYSDGTVGKTLVLQQSLTSGVKNIEVYGETSPFLYDVTILGSENGGIILKNDFNETASALSDELWKEIQFTTSGGEVAIYISGTADEDPTPNLYGNYPANFSDSDDDDLKFVLDDTDYGYQVDEAFYGNEIFGEPHSVVIRETLPAGTHNLQIWGDGTPTLYNVVIYGEINDQAMPIFLSSFNGTNQMEAVALEWETSSEINNLGFNILKAESKNNILPLDEQFLKINDKLIPGAGNSSIQNTYKYLDNNVKEGLYYWYKLEDIDYEGNSAIHKPISVYKNFVNSDFYIKNSYPNPFNIETTIEFYLPKDNIISIAIYNSGGQIIEERKPKFYLKGLNQFKWVANGVASGVYYVKISTKKELRIKKTLLLK